MSDGNDVNLNTNVNDSQNDNQSDNDIQNVDIFNQNEVTQEDQKVDIFSDEKKDEASQEETDAESAPEVYDFGELKLEPEVSSAFQEVAKELNLTNEKALKILNAVQPKLEEAQKRQISEIGKEWERQVKADADISGPGGRDFKKNMQIASKALKQFAPEEFIDLAKNGQLGVNPGFLKMLINIGKATSNDAAFVDGNKSEPAKTAAQILFPNG